VFSGDLGRYDDPVMHAPESVPAADYVVIESTYGNRDHDRSDPVAALGDIIERTLRRGGTVVIPAFAVGRAQSLIHALWQLRQRGGLRNIPVYLDSPMATNATALLYAYPDEHKLGSDEFQAAFAAVTYVQDVENPKRCRPTPSPRSSSRPAAWRREGGCCTTSRRLPVAIRTRCCSRASRRRNARAQAARRWPRGENSRSLVAGQCRSGGAAHAVGACRSRRVAALVIRFQSPPRHVFVVHGEAEASEALRERIQRELDWPVSVPGRIRNFRCSRG